MKKIIYIITILVTGSFFTGCDPLDDVYNELDQLPSANNKIVGDVTYTLTEDDYTLDLDDGGFLDLRFPNFGSEDQAKELVPTFLTGTYPAWGVTYNDETGKVEKASSALITYALFSPRQEQDSIVRYTVTTEDYDSNPETERFNNFDDNDQIFDFLNVRYPTPVDNMLVSLTYDFFNGSVNELNNGFFYTDGEWKFVQGLTDDEYTLVGERFPNFSNEDEADEKMPILLLDKFKFSFPEAGDIVPTMYKLFVTDVSDLDGDGRVDDRTTYSFIKYFTYDGTAWSAYNNTINETLQFGHDGTTWVPDNTIAYRITNADIALVVSALEGTYPDPASNVARFNSFDRRPSSGNYWNDDMLLEAFNVVLDARDPGAAEEQKYLLTFLTFTGSVEDESQKVIKSGGVWVYDN